MADGEVRISTRLDNKGIAKDAQAIEKEIERLSKAFDRETESIKKQTIALDDMKRKLEAIKSGDKQAASLSSMESQLRRINNEVKAQEQAYADVIKQIEAANLRLEVAQGLGDQSAIERETQALQRLDEESLRVADALESAKERAGELSSKIGELKLNPESSQEAQLLADKINLAEEKLDASKDRANDLKDALNDAFGVNPKPLNEGLEKTGKSAKKAAPAIKKFGTETKKAAESSKKAAAGFEKLAKRLTNLALGAFVFNVIRSGLRALQQSLAEVLKQNPKFVKSLNNIKVNLLTAFAPIWQYVLPAIETLMGAVEKATYTLAKFMASLFGQTYGKARDTAKQIYEQSKATEKSAQAAKEAEKANKALAKANKELAKAAAKSTLTMAGFDEINQLSTSSMDDYLNGLTEGIEAIKDAQEELNFGFDPADGYWGKFAGLLEKIKDMLAGFFTPFQKAWKKEGKNTIDAFLSAGSAIFEMIFAIGESFMDIWKSGTGEEFITNILLMLQNWYSLLGDIYSAFTNVWRETGVGNSIMLNIFSTMTNIVGVASELTERIREAWNAGGNGERIWSAILGFVDDILGTIKGMSEATLEWAGNLNLEPLMSGVATLSEAFRNLAKIILDYVGDGYKNILLPLMKWLAEIFVPKALDLLAAAFDAISAVLEALKPLAEWIWESFLVPLGKWAGERVIDLIDRLTKAFQGFSDWARDNPEKIQTMADVLLTFLAGLWIYNSSKNLVEWIMKSLIPAFKNLGGSFKTLAGKVDITSLAIAALVLGIGALALEWDNLTPAERTITMLGALGAALITAAIAVAVFHTSWSVGLAAAGIVAGLALLAGAKFFAGRKIPDALDSGETNTTGKMPSEALKMSRLNFKGSPLPMLAEGAVLYPNDPFVAVVGDQKRGKNVEAPLETIKQALAETWAEFNMGGSQEIVLELDGQEVARLLMPYTERENKRLGIRMSKN